MNIELYNGDCLDVMMNIPDKSVDMILCDLPYGTTRNKWDSVIPFEKLWLHYERVIKDNGCIALFSQTPFDKVLGASNLKLLKYEWVWVKSQVTGHLNAKKMPLKSHENILIFYKNLPVYNTQWTLDKPYKKTSGTPSTNYGKQKDSVTIVSDGRRYAKDILYFAKSGEDRRLHPTQKPVALLEYLIKTYTNEGDIVLDNCMGSGSTGVACVNTNRNFIGIELDKGYYDIAVDRIHRSREERGN